MKDGVLTAYGVATRLVRRTAKSPPLWLPAVMFPLLLFAAFAGGLSALGESPAFGYPNYTTFQFVYILLQAAATSGMLSGLAIAQDFESGFARRMMLSTRSRVPMVAGYVLAAMVRALVIMAILFVVGVIAGMEVSGSVPQVAGVVLLTLLFSLVITLWGLGFSLRARSLKAGAALQMPVMILMFLVPVYTPRPLLADWVQAIADFNPVTAVLESCRGLMVGDPVSVGLTLGVLGSLTALLLVWVTLGLRSAEAAGGLRA